MSSAPLLASMAVVSITIPMAAQTLEIASKKVWTAPLALDGHPDLQGTWLNKSATPFERPKELEGRQTLTDDEVAELKRRAERLFKGGRSDAAPGDNTFLAALANPDRFKSVTATDDSTFFDREFDNRTSLIIDPPDGLELPRAPQPSFARPRGV